jgi:hypothetical protein
MDQPMAVLLNSNHVDSLNVLLMEICGTWSALNELILFQKVYTSLGASSTIACSATVR